MWHITYTWHTYIDTVDTPTWIEYIPCVTYMYQCRCINCINVCIYVCMCVRMCACVCVLFKEFQNAMTPVLSEENFILHYYTLHTTYYIFHITYPHSMTLHKWNMQCEFYDEMTLSENSRTNKPKHHSPTNKSITHQQTKASFTLAPIHAIIQFMTPALSLS